MTLRVLAALSLLYGCKAPPLISTPFVPMATEIGNPEMASQLRLASSAPEWLGLGSGAVFQIDEARVSLGSAVVAGCDAEPPVTTEIGVWVDLLDPTALNWEAPASWCALSLDAALSPAPPDVEIDGELTAYFRGVDRRGVRYEVVDRRPASLALAVDEAAGDGAFVGVFDAAVWLEGLTLSGGFADPDGVVHVTAGLPGVFEGSAALFEDTDESGTVEPGEPELASSTVIPDQDGDGLRDDDELSQSLDPGSSDTDGDLLLDGEEVFVVGTSPLSADTDGDGLDDFLELQSGTDPLDFFSPCCRDDDGDGFPIESDCNDGDPTVFPGAPDTVGDGIDQNCDGFDG